MNYTYKKLVSATSNNFTCVCYLDKQLIIKNKNKNIARRFLTLIKPQFISSNELCCITIAGKFPQKSAYPRTERAPKTKG